MRQTRPKAIPSRGGGNTGDLCYQPSLLGPDFFFFFFSFSLPSLSSPSPLSLHSFQPHLQTHPKPAMSPPSSSSKHSESGVARLCGSGTSGFLELMIFHPIDT